MISKMRKTATVAIVMLMSMAAFMTMIPTVSATNDPPDNHVYNLWNQDWTVVDSRSYTANTLIRMQGHSVTVKNGGTLSLDHSFIDFDGASDGAVGITVESGGKLILKNGAAIWPWGIFSQYCAFLAGSTIDIDNSTVAMCSGLATPTVWAGMYVGTTNVTIDYSMIASGNIGIPTIGIYDGGKAIIRNSTVTANNAASLGLVRGSTVNIIDSFLTGGGTGAFGLISTDSNVTILKSTVSSFTTQGLNLFGNSNLKLLDSAVDHTSNAVVLGVGVHADIEGCTIQKNTNDALDADYNSTISMKANTIILNNQYGVNLYNGANLTSDSDVFNTNGVAAYNIMHSKAVIKNAGITVPGGATTIGIHAQGDSNVEVAKTLITATGAQYGIWSQGSTMNIHDSELHDCTFCIVFDQASSATLKSNVITTTKDGLIVTSGSVVDSSLNTFNGGRYTFSATYGGKVTSTSDKVKDLSANGGIIALSEYGGSIAMHNMLANGIGANQRFSYIYQYSQALAYDSTWTGFAMDDRLNGGYFLSINSSGTVAGCSYNNLMPGGTADLGWHAQVKTVWQNNVVAPNAHVTLTDSNGTVMKELTTDGQGMASFDIIDKTVDGSVVYHSDYDVSAKLNGMSGSTSANATTNLVGAKMITVHIQDTQKPMINLTSPKEGDILNTTELVVSGNYSDGGSGLGGVILQAVPGVAVGAGKTSYSGFIFTLANIPEGKYRFIANVTDVAGNLATAEVNVTIDRTVPTLTITKPLGFYLQNKTFSLNGTTEVGTNVTVNGTTVANVNGAFGTAFTLPDGDHTIVVTSTDAARNKAVTSKEVFIDTVAPVISTDLPASTIQAFPGIRLRGTLTDAQGSGPMGLMVNNHNATFDKKNGTWTLDLTLTEGLNTLTYKAFDIAGNNATLVRTVLVDTIKPVLDMTAPTAVQPLYTNKGTINVSGKVTELNLATLTVNGVTVTPDASGNFSKIVNLVNGTNTLTVVATDTAGNIAQWTYTAILDQVAPKITILSPQDGFLTNKATVEVSVFVDDETATVALMRIRMRNDTPVRKSGTANLTLGMNTLVINATDVAGNTGTASVKVTYDNKVNLVLTKPSKTSTKTTSPSITISGTSETGSKIYVNDVMVPANTDGTFTYKMLVKEGKTTVIVKAIDPAGNTDSKTFSATRTEAKQYDMSMLLGLDIVLMIVGLLVGIVAGRIMAKPKAKPPMEQPDDAEVEPAPSKKVEEEKPFTAEEEEEEPAKPAPKEQPKPEPKVEPKPEPKVEPKPDPKVEPKLEPKKDDDSLDSLLKEMDKGKK